jgi:CTP-dependent riboflavin kinase
MNEWVYIPIDMIEQKWYKDGVTAPLYIRFCLKADDNTRSFETSRSKLVKETGLTDKRLRRALRELEETGFLTTVTTKKGTTITVRSI